MITEEFFSITDVYGDIDSTCPLQLDSKDLEMIKEALCMYGTWHSVQSSSKKNELEQLQLRILKEGLRRARFQMREFMAENADIK